MATLTGVAFKFAERMAKVSPSATLKLTAKAKEMKAKGLPVLSFGAGEPDFDTPQAVKDEAVRQLAAGFTNSGGPSGDKLSTLTQLMISAMQHGMIWVGSGLMVDGDINRLSSYVGAMAQSLHGSTEPLEADLKTAQLFGKRVAEATLRWTK